MNLLLFHGDFAWLLAGIVIFVGLVVFLIKLVRGHIGSTLASLCVWVFVFSLHGGTGTGIMSATVAALLFDMMGIPIIKAFTRR